MDTVPFDVLVEDLNRKLPLIYQFKLDPIYSVDNNNGLVFLGRAKSINNDMTFFPFDLLHIPYNKYKECKPIIWWINRKIFGHALFKLSNNDKLDYETLDVRLRIANNKVLNCLSLNENQKREWVELLKIVYYERLRVMIDYYLDKICQLPFLVWGHWIAPISLNLIIWMLK